jgi:hydroxymethylbilane synthase
MASLEVRIGTRKSALARTQSTWVLDSLKAAGVQARLVEISSDGDKDRASALYAMEMEAPGLFCKQLEDALLAGTIDIAVHSLKDLPTTQPEGLSICAIPEREVPEDWLLVRRSQGDSNEALPIARGARIGTSSLRREAQLISVRKDLRIQSVRGNLPSRIHALETEKFDAIVLAAAGLRRLGIDLSPFTVVPLEPSLFVPAPGQGALAIEVHERLEQRVVAPLKRLDHEATRVCVELERKVMRELEGGCTLPFGAWCRKLESGFKMDAFLGVAVDRSEKCHDWVSFHSHSAQGKPEEILRDMTSFFVEYVSRK